MKILGGSLPLSAPTSRPNQRAAPQGDAQGAVNDIVGAICSVLIQNASANGGYSSKPTQSTSNISQETARLPKTGRSTQGHEPLQTCDAGLGLASLPMDNCGSVFACYLNMTNCLYLSAINL